MTPRNDDEPGLLRRIGHTPRRRLLHVTSVTELSPTMRRIALGGDDLEPDFPFTPLAAADHVKIALPDEATGQVTLPTGPPTGVDTLREYTIRAFRPQTGELVIDFVLHEHGPAGRWAAAAQPGSMLGVMGPRGSQVHPDDASHYLLVADPTAFPAAERFCEELPAATRIDLVALALDGSAPRELGPQGRATVHWITGTDPVAAAEQLVALVAGLTLEPDTIAWGAGEAGVMRELRTHLRGRLDPQRVLVRGYWRSGWAGSLPHEDR